MAPGTRSSSNQSKTIDEDELSNQDTTHLSDMASTRGARDLMPGAASIKKQYRPPKQDSSTEAGDNSNDETYEPGKKTQPSRKQNQPRIVPNKPAGIQKTRKTASPTYSEHFKTDVEAVWKRYESHEEAMEESARENQSLSDKIQQLPEELRSYQDGHESLLLSVQESKQEEEKLKQASKTLNKNHAELRRHYDEARSSVAQVYEESVAHIAHHAKVSDDTISGDWGKIAYNVGNLVSQFLTLSSEKIVATTQDTILTTLVEKCKGLQHLKKFHLQYHLWARLVEDVFWNGGKLWAGELGKEFVATCRRLRGLNLGKPEELGIISRLKSTTAIDLDKEFGINHTAIDEVVDHLTTEISIFAPENAFKGLRQGVSKMVHQALELQIVLMKSKAIFVVEPPSKIIAERLGVDVKDMYYAEDYTQGIDNCDEPNKIQMVASPFLGKIGSADGHDFDSSFVLCKAKLVISMVG